MHSFFSFTVDTSPFARGVYFYGCLFMFLLLSFIAKLLLLLMLLLMLLLLFGFFVNLIFALVHLSDLEGQLSQELLHQTTFKKPGQKSHEQGNQVGLKHIKN